MTAFDGSYFVVIEQERKQGRKEPRAGSVYTTEEIINKLALADSPSLNFRHNGRRGCVQDSHLTKEQLLSVPGMGERRWKYERTTYEWIPVFNYVDERPITDVVDLEPYFDFDGTDDRKSWWATPKGFPRDQR